MTAPRRNFPIIGHGLPWGDEAREILNNGIAGKMNIGGEVTLTENTTATTLTDEIITADSVICLMPMTANAAGALATTYFDAPTRGSVVINHANDVNEDKTFKYTVTG